MNLEAKIKRRTWSAEEKLFFIQMLLVINTAATGKPKSVDKVSAEYNIAKKTLYEWMDIYRNYGPDAFKAMPRKVSDSKSRKPELIIEILDISLYHPEWSANTIIKNLSPANKRLTIPTVQKILKTENLETSSKRFANTEWAYTKNNLALPPETIDLLIKNNPCLNLFKINKTVNGLVFFLKILCLDNYFGNGTGYIVLATETNSLDVFGIYWSGNNIRNIEDFIIDLNRLVRGNNKRNVYFEIEQKWPSTNFNSEKLKQDINWLNNVEPTYQKDKFLRGLKVVFDAIRKEFLKKYDFTNTYKLNEDFNSYLFQRRISSGPIGYPTFLNNQNFLQK